GHKYRQVLQVSAMTGQRPAAARKVSSCSSTYFFSQTVGGAEPSEEAAQPLIGLVGRKDLGGGPFGADGALGHEDDALRCIAGKPDLMRHCEHGHPFRRE